MIGVHHSKYTLLQAQYLGASMTMLFAIFFYLRNWNYSFGKILLKLMLIVLLPINIVITLTMHILYWLGYIFNLIPILRDVLSIVFVLIFGGLASFLFMLMNAYDFHNYVEAAEDFNLSNVY